MKGASGSTAYRTEGGPETVGLSIFRKYLLLKKCVLLILILWGNASSLSPVFFSCGQDMQTHQTAAGSYTVQNMTELEAGDYLMRSGNVAGLVKEPLQDVRFPELSPEEAEQFRAIEEKLRSEEWEGAFSEMSGFLLVSAAKYVPGTERKYSESASTGHGNWIWKTEGDVVRPVCPGTVAELCREWILELPEAGKDAWLAYADVNVREELAALGIPEKIPSIGTFGIVPPASLPSVSILLERIRRQYPYSSFEAELLEILARLAWNEGRFLDAERFWDAELAERERLSSVNQPVAMILAELPALQELKARTEAIRKFYAPFQKLEKTALAQNIRVSMVQVTDGMGRVLFDDLLPEEQRGTLFSDRKRNLECERAEIPNFAVFSPETNILAVRMGTRVTFWPEGVSETRPQPYLAFLDLLHEGALLGIAVPESPWRTYVGNPLADGKFVYIPSLLIKERGEFSLDILSLANGTLVERIPLFSADLREIENESLFLPISWVGEQRIRVGSPECRVVREVEVSELP